MKSLQRKTKREIEEILKSGSFDLVVGHSLGGFYTLISTSASIKKILINPSIEPEQDLKRISSVKEEILKDFATLNEEKRKMREKQKQKNEAFQKDMASLFNCESGEV